jgi:phosphatidylglycerophosphate synthase
MRWLVTPNKVTMLRMFVAGAAIGLYGAGSRGGAAIVFGISSLALTICAIGLDGVDGYLARRLRMTSALGAQLDILGDRVIENLFFIYFAASAQISVWVPLVFFVRGLLTDFLRGIAATRRPVDGRASAGEFQLNRMLMERWSARIVASRVSRGVYAALKCVCFCALGVEWIAQRAQISAAAKWTSAIHSTVRGIVFATVAFCVLRALPVFWEGLRDFRVAERTNVNTDVRVAPRAVHAVARPIVAARWTL